MRKWAWLIAGLWAACSSGPAMVQGEGGEGGSVSTGDSGGAGGDGGSGGQATCSVPSLRALAGGPVVLAAAGDLNGDGRLDLVVSRSTGLQVFLGEDCGELREGASGLAGSTIIGLDAGPIDAVPGDDVMVVTSDGALTALSGTDLHVLFTGKPPNLGPPGAVVAVRLDTDADVDAAVFTSGFAQVSRMENTGSSWLYHVSLQLPPGIRAVRAGDLGGNSRDELLFLGGGLAEVVSTADFDFSDVRVLSASNHPAAAFGDLDGDGKPDAVIASDSAIELWKGDGATTIALSTSVPLPHVIDLSTTRKGTVLAVALDASGGLATIGRGITGKLTVLSHAKSGLSHPVRVFAGDVDGDGLADAIAVDASGQAYVWRGLVDGGS